MHPVILYPILTPRFPPPSPQPAALERGVRLRLHASRMIKVTNTLDFPPCIDAASLSSSITHWLTFAGYENLTNRHGNI